MYGGYGGGYGGMPGMPQNPNDPNSLTNRFNNSTAATFQMLEGIVMAFGGFAQMLESTYMATHSSFFGRSMLLVWSIPGSQIPPQQWFPSQSNLAISVTRSAPFWVYSP
jgi:hypothetical protein